jgi:hypothetical protein
MEWFDTQDVGETVPSGDSRRSCPSTLERSVLDMDDGRFERALAAWQRFVRRQSYAAPSGAPWADARDGNNATHITGRKPRKDRSVPSLYETLLKARRSLRHCEALEAADRVATAQVRRWLRQLERGRGEPLKDPRAYRSAAKVATVIEACGPAARASRRARL